MIHSTLKRLCLVASLALLPGLASAAMLPVLKTRFGNLYMGKDYTLNYKGVPLENPFMDVSFEFQQLKFYSTKSVDVVVLSGSLRPNCVQYQLLLLSVTSPAFSSVFGTCDANAKVTQEGESIVIRMKTQMEGEKKLPVTFVLKNHELRQLEHIPFWPQGFFEPNPQ